MSVFVQATIHVRSAGMAKFAGAISQLVEIMESHGWKLSSAFISRTGRLNTVVDIWELDDFAHFDSALGKAITDPRFPAIKAALDETVEDETLVFLNKAPWAR